MITILDAGRPGTNVLAFVFNRALTEPDEGRLLLEELDGVWGGEDILLRLAEFEWEAEGA